MICLLDTEETPDVNIITRIKRAHKGYRAIKARELLILGVRVLHITIYKTPSISQKSIQQLITYAAKMMGSEHVSKVLFSKNFPYRALVLREGFVEMDEYLLMEALAGKIASKFAGSEKIAAFFAERLTGDAERAFNEMCRDFRYVIAVVVSDGGCLYTALSRRLGISVIGQPTQQQLLRADVAVFFNPPEQKTVLSESCLAIPVSAAALDGVVCRHIVSGMSVALENGTEPGIPEGFLHEPLYAAAIYAGTLRRDEVILNNIKIEELFM